MIIIGSVDYAFSTDYPYYYLWKNGTQIGQIKDKNFKATNSLNVIDNTTASFSNPMYIFYDQTALTFRIMQDDGPNNYWHYYFLTFSLSNTSIKFWCDEYSTVQSSSAQVGAGVRNALQQHNESGVTYWWFAVHQS